MRSYYRSMTETTESVRGYDAGDNSRGNWQWMRFNEPAEAENRVQRDTIRARARDLENNSDIMNAVIDAFERNVTGRRLEVQAKTEDGELNNRIEALWAEWTRARNFDVQGDFGFLEMMRKAVRRKKIDGGCLFLKTFASGGKIPFQVQLMEVDEIAKDWMKPSKSGNILCDGVEVEPSGKIIGFWLKKPSFGQMEAVGMDATFFEANRVIYYRQKKRPSQIREISDFACILERVRDVNEFITAVSMRQRLLACIGLFFSKNSPNTNNMAVGRSSAVGEAVENKKMARYMAPGMMLEGNVNETIEVIDPKGTSVDAAVYNKTLLRQIAAAVGLSYEGVSRDLSDANYSSARQNMIEDELTYSAEMRLLESVVMDEIYQTFIISCVLSGLLTIPDFWENKQAYFRHHWVRGGKQWIDPLKEANANKSALQSGIKSYIQMCGEQGVDWQNQLNDIARAEDYARELGLTLGVLKIEEKKEPDNGQ
jgi:lambda family phage portal protein